MTEASRRDRWRAEVFRSKTITDTTRVLLLALADHMRADGRVSVPRNQLVAMLERDPKRITERIGEAVKAGLLDRVASGAPGRTAEYVALIPTGKGAPVRTPRKGADSRAHWGADGRTPMGANKGADGGVANSKGSRSRTPARSRNDHELAAEVAQAVSRKTGADVSVGSALRWLREIPGVADANNPVGLVISIVTKNRAQYIDATPTPPPWAQVRAQMESA